MLRFRRIKTANQKSAVEISFENYAHVHFSPEDYENREIMKERFLIYKAGWEAGEADTEWRNTFN